MIDVNSIMTSVYTEVKNRITSMFDTMRNFAITMCINDLRMSKDMEYAPDVQNAMANSMELVQTDDTHFSIVLHIAETLSDKAKELIEFCFYTSKQYAFGG